MDITERLFWESTEPPNGIYPTLNDYTAALAEVERQQPPPRVSPEPFFVAPVRPSVPSVVIEAPSRPCHSRLAQTCQYCGLGFDMCPKCGTAAVPKGGNEPCGYCAQVADSVRRAKSWATPRHGVNSICGVSSICVGSSYPEEW